MPSFVPKDEKCWCGNPLEVPGQPRKYSIDGKPVCKNCYFGEFGLVVEKHPIGAPKAPLAIMEVGDRDYKI